MKYEITKEDYERLVAAGYSHDCEIRYTSPSTITDYKNVSTKPKTDSIPFGYKIQMLAYAYADRERGINTDRIRLVYTVRPTKTLPVRVFVVNHMIQESDWILIENTLNLIAESVLAVRNDPSITHLVFKSMNLKQQ